MCIYSRVLPIDSAKLLVGSRFDFGFQHHTSGTLTGNEFLRDPSPAPGIMPKCTGSLSYYLCVEVLVPKRLFGQEHIGGSSLFVCLFCRIIGVEIIFTEDDYRTNEDGGSLPVFVSKSLRIASPITLTVSPLTVAQALAAGVQVFITIPQDNPLSPSRASELVQDQPC